MLEPLTRIGRVVTGRPRLFVGLATAIAVAAAAAALGLAPLTAALVGWDAGIVVYLVLFAALVRASGPADVRRRAAGQDVGSVLVLILTAAAALTSLVAIYVEVGQTAGDPLVLWRLALIVATVGLSWFLVQTIFATHYAHEYYGSGSGDGGGGLEFPGRDQAPGYADFLYFALVIGMTSQVSDVAVTSARMRRTVSAHGVVAFWFNAAVLALLINIAAGLIGGK
ncbi:MAG TPA: DUF1345 domain-containing protein [Bauldia sp.]|nr:DUF1345 domain-containing protein [Bauldia sp.]